MNAARTLLPAEQGPHQRATDIRDRFISLGMFHEALWCVGDAVRKGGPLSDESEILERLKAPSNRQSSGVANTGYPNIKFSAREEVPRVASIEKKTSMIGTFGNFTIEATSVLNGLLIRGWRITSKDETTCLQHEFYVSEGRIHHVQFQSSPPWSHSSQFVVGAKVRRIMESEKRAILRAISDFNLGVSSNG
jgi:hypothetical protein